MLRHDARDAKGVLVDQKIKKIDVLIRQITNSPIAKKVIAKTKRYATFGLHPLLLYANSIDIHRSVQQVLPKRCPKRA